MSHNCKRLLNNLLSEVLFAPTEDRSSVQVDIKLNNGQVVLDYKSLPELLEYHEKLKSKLQEMISSGQKRITFSIRGPFDEKAFRYLHVFLRTSSLTNSLGVEDVAKMVRIAFQLNNHKLVKNIANKFYKSKPMNKIKIENSESGYYYDIAKMCDNNEEIQRMKHFLSHDDTIAFYKLNSVWRNMTEAEVKTLRPLKILCASQIEWGAEVEYVYPNWINYIKFCIPSEEGYGSQITFIISVFDGIRWHEVIDNSTIWCNSWHWFFIEEIKVKKIQVLVTGFRTKLTAPYSFKLLRFEAKYILKKLFFQYCSFEDPMIARSLLTPTHNAIEYPIKNFKYPFGNPQIAEYTYCMSKASVHDKESKYYYHTIGVANEYLEFYLCQTCFIDSLRFRLWDLDERKYDYEVKIKYKEGVGDDDCWQTLASFEDASSWQYFSFQMIPIRFIRLIGLKISGAKDNDKEFAVIDFQCPSQLPRN